MKKLLQILELFKLLLLLPFNITNGKKVRAYQKIKKQLITINLL